MTADKDALLNKAYEAARDALSEYRQQDDYLLAHGASLLSDESHEIFHVDALRRAVTAAITAALAEKDDGGWKRRIVCAANLAPDGTVTLQVRHCAPPDHQQGFIDNQGNWLTREQAYLVAKEAGQIIRRVGGDDGKLFSENIY